MARRGGRWPRPSRRRRECAVARPRRARSGSPGGVRIDRPGPACAPTLSEPTGECRGPVATGARGRPRDRRAHRGDAGDGSSDRRRQPAGDHLCGDRRRGRGDCRGERRADGTPGPSTERDVHEGRERRVDRPHGRLTVPSPGRARRRRVQSTRELDAHRHVPVASQTRRATRRSWSWWSLAAVGPRTIRCGSSGSDRHCAADRPR